MPATPSPRRRPAPDRSPRRLHVDLELIPYFLVALALLCSAALVYVQKRQFDATHPDDTLQAVFLTNGQVYFGHLEPIGRRTMRLDSVFYLQQQSTQPDASAAESGETLDPSAADSGATQFSVIRLGSEIHQPTDQLIINREQILFWENLQADSQVLAAIRQEGSGQ
jgi:hypothetical protein